MSKSLHKKAREASRLCLQCFPARYSNSHTPAYNQIATGRKYTNDIEYIAYREYVKRKLETYSTSLPKRAAKRLTWQCLLLCDTEPQFPCGWGFASAVVKSSNSLVLGTSFAFRKNNACIEMVEANAVQDALWNRKLSETHTCISYWAPIPLRLGFH